MSFLTKDSRPVELNHQIRKIKFENQDAEYYTVGWMAFCQFLGKVAMLDTSRVKSRELRELSLRLTKIEALKFEDFVTAKALQKSPWGDDNEIFNLMGHLSIITEKKINFPYRKIGNPNDNRFASSRININPHMMDAIWLKYSESKEARVSYKHLNLDRHEENIEELVDYYIRDADLMLVKQDLYEELNRIHRNQEYWAGYYDHKIKMSYPRVALPTEL